MIKMHKAVKTTIIATLILSISSGVVYANTNVFDNKNEDGTTKDIATAETEMIIGTGTLNENGDFVKSDTGTTISAIVPTSFICTINPNSETYREAFVSPKFTITNTGNTPITTTVAIVQVGEVGKDTMEILSHSDGREKEYYWKGLNVKDSLSQIALGLVEKKSTGTPGTQGSDLIDHWYSSQGKALGIGTIESKYLAEVIDGINSRKFELKAKHGMAFNSPVSMEYNIVYTIAMLGDNAPTAGEEQ